MHTLGLAPKPPSPDPSPPYQDLTKPKRPHPDHNHRAMQEDLHGSITTHGARPRLRPTTRPSTPTDQTTIRPSRLMNRTLTSPSPRPESSNSNPYQQETDRNTPWTNQKKSRRPFNPWFKPDLSSPTRTPYRPQSMPLNPLNLAAPDHAHALEPTMKNKVFMHEFNKSRNTIHRSINPHSISHKIYIIA